MNARVRRAVFERDRVCQGQRILPHHCRDTMGGAHSMNDQSRMTFEHVRDADKPAMSLKPDDDVRHGLMVCGWWNVNMAPRFKDEERALLARRYSRRNIAKTLDRRAANRYSVGVGERNPGTE